MKIILKWPNLLDVMKPFSNLCFLEKVFSFASNSTKFITYKRTNLMYSSYEITSRYSFDKSLKTFALLW